MKLPNILPTFPVKRPAEMLSALTQNGILFKRTVMRVFTKLQSMNDQRIAPEHPQTTVKDMLHIKGMIELAKYPITTNFLDGNPLFRRHTLAIRLRKLLKLVPWFVKIRPIMQSSTFCTFSSTSSNSTIISLFSSSFKFMFYKISSIVPQTKNIVDKNRKP